jgi:hypothetical protein
MAAAEPRQGGLALARGVARDNFFRIIGNRDSLLFRRFHIARRRPPRALRSARRNASVRSRRRAARLENAKSAGAAANAFISLEAAKEFVCTSLEKLGESL